MKKLLLGITGQIAAGKSLVSEMIVQIVADRVSIHHLDGDKITHQILMSDQRIKQQVFESFGVAVFHAGNQIDRSALGAIIFHDPNKMNQLNQIIHPIIRENLLQTIARLKATEDLGLIIINGALLAYMGLDELCDYVVEVKADQDIRLRRLMERNHLSVQHAEERIHSQSLIPINDPQKQITITNNGLPSFLLKELSAKLGPILDHYLQ